MPVTLKILIILFCISFHIAEISTTCTENVEKSDDTVYGCRNNYGCRNYHRIIKNTIFCSQISADDFIIYGESRTQLDYYYSKYDYPLEFKVTDSEIKILPASAFKNLKNITDLFLVDIKLKKIMPAAFHFLDRLQALYLGHNDLTTISDGIFNTLTGLRILDLSNNRIETITEHALIGTYLNHLDLSSNKISVLEEALLKSLKSLDVLDISHNNLYNISGFDNLDVTGLNLSYNAIENVNFVNLGNVSQLIDISFNNITDIINLNLSRSAKLILSHNNISRLYKNEVVTVLDVRYNQLNILNTGVFNSELLELYASFNLISSISVDTFFGLERLTHLYLDNNNLSSIPNSCFKYLKSLTHLNLSGNHLFQLKFGTFDNLKNLESLDISKNNFKEFPQYTLHSLSILRELFFQKNEISDINADELVKYSPNLNKVDLDSNVWSCEKLINVIHKLKSRGISVREGKYWEESNIYGIKCYEIFKNKNFDKNVSQFDIGESKLNSFFNEDFTKTILYKYFNQDFKESEFFKYLESLKNLNNTEKVGNIEKVLGKFKMNYSDIFGEIKKSEMYNYFNKDFKNSSFYRYLENMKNKNFNVTLKTLDNNQLDGLINALKNISRELDSIVKANQSFQEDFKNSAMYNYFNKDFTTSNFFNYLEKLNFRKVMNEESTNITIGQMSKLIGAYENTNYPTYNRYLCVIIILLLLSTCCIFVIAFRQILPLKNAKLERENVELI